jgi:hypothetical protein
MYGLTNTILATLKADAVAIGGVTSVAYLAQTKLALTPGQRVGPDYEWARDEAGELYPIFDYRFLVGVAAIALNASGLTDKTLGAVLDPQTAHMIVDVLGFGALAAWGVNEATRAASAGTIPFIGVEAPKFLTEPLEAAA